MTSSDLNRARRLLCSLQNHLRDAVVRARNGARRDLADIAAITEADTIYRIDKISEAAILSWFSAKWPKHWPVELVMEGIEGAPTTFPAGTPVEKTVWKCILDPIDGTRGIMYDKRPAWSLAGLAPQHGAKTNLTDIVVAAMTELPTSKQWRSDQLSVVKGAGPKGVVAEWTDVRTGKRGKLKLRASQATDFKHCFASFAHFFPDGKTLLAEMEEAIWAQLHARYPTGSPLIFDDQYISTGGQLYELLAGHDRFIGDVRPEAFTKLKLSSALVCHPYDLCTALVAQEAGVIVEAPHGGKVKAPLDTTTPVSWVAFANPVLAKKLRPVLRQMLRKYLDRSSSADLPRDPE
jgi:hypothetical protein